MKNFGHTVLITGGAAGIGLALAEKFLEYDNEVIIVGRDTQKLDLVKAKHPRVIAYACDLADAAQQDALVERLYIEHPSLSVLVNNAGIQYNYSFLEKEPEAIAALVVHEIAVNLTSPVKLTAKLMPLLARQPEAAVVNVSSGLGLVPKESAPVYCATKAALHLFSKALRWQLEESRIKVFEIIPPVVDTDMTRGRGKNKIKPEALAAEFFTYYTKDKQEVPIGKVKLLGILQRLLPSIPERILRKG
ncbi:SDR family oxidoreductase [Paenibacillus sp. NEAU-GSW1]|uniref:SDR family oxidoreductase n=1 Tax=Paenibacillus sp. NEAU-GSW1 TaxID=2682486 RepID=UPI0012E18A9A|nr:SDR family oxidoreductase [Paenibacillus sp. NEAU-GSW1]MUT66500.1 SDR family NAD(P)-dependent oxidoreductase [Paenibacillus sp. NEAU-GSW1]